MRTLAAFVLLAAAAVPASAEPAAGGGVDVQLAQRFGATRLRLALPLREAGPQRLGADLVFRAKTDAGDGPPALRGGAEHAVQLELQRPLGPWTGFGHVGWRQAGTADAGASGWYAEIGASRAPSRRLELGAVLDLWQGTAGGAPQRQASAYAALDHGGWRWQLALARDFGAAADTTLELTLRTRF